MLTPTGWSQNSGSWGTGAPMPLSRQELATGWLNGKLYVVGGYDANAQSTNTVQVYNPTTNTWSFARALPIAVNHNAAAVVGGKLYSFGAGVGETFSYDPSTNSWTTRASSHYVHRGTAAVGVINDKIYVAGGEGTPSQREMEMYDPVANTWTIKAAMSVPRNHTGGGVINGKFYVVGGRAGPSTNALEVYNPQTNSWSTLAPMPTARSGFATAVVNSELWVFGGEDPQTLVLHAEVEVYNPVTNSWRREPNMPAPRHGIWASVDGNKIYIPGGGTTPALVNPTNTNQIFTVTGGTDSIATVADFNNDGHPDYVVRNPGTHQTAIWYLNNNVYLSGVLGPTITVGWSLDGVADFNRDVHPDYALFNSTTDQTAIWYMSGPTRIG
ncbi:MAG TPA: kelch repeat-containing protein, partial [Candidatus Udaeobacter sp.]|nr:kelch repeat-containing protein [Candidatus Udaeobacter sp.]